MSQEVLLEIAVDAPLPGTFTYKSLDPVATGCRVMVPFGRMNRKLSGIVVGQAEEKPGVRVKAISGVLDSTPVLSESMLTLGRWLSDYYLHPIGDVFKTMLPASEKVKTKVSWDLTDFGRGAWEDSSSPYYPLIRALFKRRTPLSDASFSKNRIAAEESLGISANEMVARLDKYELAQRQEDSGFTRLAPKGESDESAQASGGDKLKLTEQQSRVFKSICSGIDERGASKPYLLWGVTGAGKTEIYLQSIAHMFSSSDDGQALVLVPEISLTPQMTMVFEKRFPSDVAVVHSALDSKERWRRLDRIRKNQARILVGPRSAVFAPFKNLELVLVDEEHDSSYKQTTGLHYNGRDVAILRAKIEGATTVLGSATPSVESFNNASSGKYNLLELLERVQNRPLPEIRILEQKPSRARGQTVKGGLESCDIPVSEDLLQALEDNCARSEQSIVIVNRRGFAYFLYSLKEKSSVSCPQCSVSLTVHKGSSTLKCHYCEYQKSLSEFTSAEDDYLIVGYGSEQAEQFLQRKLPNARIVRVDSDTVTKKGALETILSDFRAGKIDVLVGTQILAKGHDFPNVTLICLLEVDQMLNLPDFRAGERTFQLIVQAAGRAGRAELKGRVILQTQKPNDLLIQEAVSQDYRAFADRELGFREAHNFPPFSKMVHFEFNCPHQDKLDAYMNLVDKAILNLMEKQPNYRETVTVLGPTVPPIEMIRGRYRRSVILSSKVQSDLWNSAKYLKLSCAKFPSDFRVKVDVDPQSIL